MTDITPQEIPTPSCLTGHGREGWDGSGVHGSHYGSGVHGSHGSPACIATSRCAAAFAGIAGKRFAGPH
jgi:hypothetical protein